MTVSVIIPTLNASGDIEKLLEKLSTQTVKAEEIIIVDSSSDDDTASLAKAYPDVRVIEIPRKDFDHGGTRDMAIRQAKGDFSVLLTQDAVPADDRLIENLLRPFADELVAGVTGRQLPKADAREYEKLVRAFNYPETGNIRSAEDIGRLGIKAFFFSDACAAYRKDVYLKLGGFEKDLLTDEDLFFAARMLKAGYKVAYASNAGVYHSHNLSLKEQYRRNYIQGIEFRKHSELLDGVSLEGEGKKMVKYVSGELLRRGRIISFAQFGFDCVARLLGSRAGRK